MLKGYRYRLYPKKHQAALMEKTFGTCRLVYNLALQAKMYAWQSDRIRLSSIDLCYQLVELKEAYPWMKEVDSQALQASVKKLDKAFKVFFRGGGFPHFKSKHRGVQSFQCPANTRRIDWEKGTLTIPKITDIPIVLSRRFTGEIKTVTISRTPSGKFYASILVEDGQRLPAKPSLRPQALIGLDVGINSLVVSSDGRRFEPNRALQQNRRRLQVLQRRHSRKVKGSRNREKSRLRLARLYERISHQRNDYLHKVTTTLICDSQTDGVVVEDLNVAGMVQNHRLARALQDVSLGTLLNYLKYKAAWYGKHVVEIDRFAPSSKRCSGCGSIYEALTLSERQWTCSTCGSEHDRDHNAAINIRWYGIKKSKLNHETTPEGIREEPVESWR